LILQILNVLSVSMDVQAVQTLLPVRSAILDFFTIHKISVRSAQLTVGNALLILAARSVF
jgi:hypothetical protein